jgi:enoyl-CoA hydratase
MDEVLLERAEAGVVHVVLNRPQRFNAFNAELVEQLHATFDGLARDVECRVIVLRGNGKHFCAGADLAGHGVAPTGDGSHSPQDWMAIQQHISSLIPKLRSLPQPVIASIHGAATGGGFALALASDIRICADDARFNAAFVRVGLSACDIGVSWLLPRLLGSSRAFELLLSGRFVAAQEAERIGLVSAAVPREDLPGRTAALVSQIVGNSPYGVRMTKKIMWAQLETGSLLAGIAMEDSTQVTAALSADHREAVASFVEHRDPTFENR